MLRIFYNLYTVFNTKLVLPVMDGTALKIR